MSSSTLFFAAAAEKDSSVRRARAGAPWPGSASARGQRRRGLRRLLRRRQAGARQLAELRQRAASGEPRRGEDGGEEAHDPPD
jgi:hypothetical protein